MSGLLFHCSPCNQRQLATPHTFSLEITYSRNVTGEKGTRSYISRINRFQGNSVHSQNQNEDLTSYCYFKLNFFLQLNVPHTLSTNTNLMGKRNNVEMVSVAVNVAVNRMYSTE